MRPPLADSWLVPGGVSVSRPPNLFESREPSAVWVGTILLTDLLKSRGKKPQPFDDVILIGHLAGEATYTSGLARMPRGRLPAGMLVMT